MPEAIVAERPQIQISLDYFLVVPRRSKLIPDGGACALAAYAAHCTHDQIKPAKAVEIWFEDRYYEKLSITQDALCTSALILEKAGLAGVYGAAGDGLVCYRLTYRGRQLLRTIQPTLTF